MKFIETVIEWELLIDRCKNQDILVTPILSDLKTHPVMNTLCVFSVSTGPELFLIGCNHTDVETLDVSILSSLSRCQRVWTPDKKLMLPFYSGLNLYDSTSLEYLYTDKIIDTSVFLTSLHKKMYQLYERHVKVNISVPIMRHIEYIASVNAHHWNIITEFSTKINQPEYKFLNEVAIPTLYELEYNGLHIEKEQFVQKYGSKMNKFIRNELIYTQYNLYTSTGRCSNRFGGVNFAAINKSDGTRNLYTSRFDNGVLVSSDFESFHLRLIAEMIEYEFSSDTRVHEILGKEYFNVDELTPDQYEQGKVITFQLLYGTTRNTNVPEFFKRVYSYIDMLMVLLNTQGYISSPYFKRKITKSHIGEVSPSKVFNYMVQLAETERNLKVLQKVLPLFKNTNSKPVLYTYDSILFDFDPTDGRELLITVIDILTENGKYPMRSYFGKTYDSMNQISI